MEEKVGKSIKKMENYLNEGRQAIPNRTKISNIAGQEKEKNGPVKGPKGGTSKKTSNRRLSIRRVIRELKNNLRGIRWDRKRKREERGSEGRRPDRCETGPEFSSRRNHSYGKENNDPNQHASRGRNVFQTRRSYSRVKNRP